MGANVCRRHLGVLIVKDLRLDILMVVEDEDEELVTGATLSRDLTGGGQKISDIIS